MGYSTDRSVRKILIIVFAATTVFGVLLAGFLFWFLGNEEEAVTKSTDEFIAALEAKDPSAAPDGGEDYVRGIPLVLGPVQDAERLKVDKISRGSGSNSHSFWVSEVLLRTERGAAVIELRYSEDGFDPSNADIAQIYELKPGDIDSKLNAEAKAAIKQGFKARGSKAIGSTVLDGTFTADGKIETRDEDPSPGDPAPAEPTPSDELPQQPSEAELEKQRRQIEKQQREGQKRLKCVQAAEGDIEKLQKCIE